MMPTRLNDADTFNNFDTVENAFYILYNCYSCFIIIHDARAIYA